MKRALPICVVTALSAGFFVLGCDSKEEVTVEKTTTTVHPTTSETAGDKVARAADKTGDVIERGAQKTGEALNTAAEKTGQALGHAVDAVNEKVPAAIDRANAVLHTSTTKAATQP